MAINDPDCKSNLSSQFFFFFFSFFNKGCLDKEMSVLN